MLRIMNNTRFLGIQNRFWIRAGAICLILAMVLVTGLTPDQAQAAGGDFSLDLTAAAPQTYDQTTGGGAFNNDTSNSDTVEQLEGGAFACGDVVSFLTKIVVADTARANTDAPQTIEISYVFQADSTGQSGVGFSNVVGVEVNYGQVENGDNYLGNSPGVGGFGLDGGINDKRQGPTLGPNDTPADLGSGGSTATIVSTQPGIVGTASNTLLTLQVDDLERAETVIVRVDVILACIPGSDPTGNVQSYVSAARVTKINDIVPANDTISVGNQTIPLKLGGNVGVPTPTDWGDAPDTYGTLLANSGPRHGQDVNLGIGATWDSENDGIPTTGAVGDDDDASDDEDGITDPQIRVGDTSVTLPVASRNTSATPATLRCWIDFDRNGVFDDGSQSDVVPIGGNSVSNLVFDISSYAFSAGQDLFIRCRIAYDSTQVANPTGDAATGEVEDLQVFVQQTLAVSIGYFLAEQDGDTVHFTWQTATETGTAGFNLLAESDGDLVQLNPELIPSTVIDSVEPTDYSYEATSTATVFYIEEIEVSGKTDRIGPFVLGTPSGVHSGVNVQSTPMIWLPMIMQ